MRKFIETLKVTKVELSEEEKKAIITANNIFYNLCKMRKKCEGCMFWIKNECQENIYYSAVHKLLDCGLIVKDDEESN